MPLRSDNYKSIYDLLKKRCDPKFRALATAGLQLADSFLQLHAQGFCYQDISNGNVFFDPKTGEILICDNDNVTINGDPLGSEYVTPGFIAPEIVQGKAKPSTQTDLHSLAVLLFYMFMIHHPLEGKKESLIHCFDLPASTKIYGTEPVFIFDPGDDSNRPVRGYQDNALTFWPIYPTFLRNLFTRAFTVGLRDPQHGRVRESEWRAVLSRLRDVIFYCARCGKECFYDEDGPHEQGWLRPCWSCHANTITPLRMQLGRQLIMLNHDSQLYAHHLEPDQLYDFSQPMAEVSRHPRDPGIWGLKNLTNSPWTATSSEGVMQTVDPGRSITLKPELKINFGKTEGQVRF